MERLNTCVLEHCYRESNALADALANIATDNRVKELNISELSIACYIS